MAEKKVLTNPNLLNIILSFTGVEIKKKVLYLWKGYKVSNFKSNNRT